MARRLEGTRQWAAAGLWTSNLACFRHAFELHGADIAGIASRLWTVERLGQQPNRTAQDLQVRRVERQVGACGARTDVVHLEPDAVVLGLAAQLEAAFIGPQRPVAGHGPLAGAQEGVGHDELGRPALRRRAGQAPPGPTKEGAQDDNQRGSETPEQE